MICNEMICTRLHRCVAPRNAMYLRACVSVNVSFADWRSQQQGDVLRYIDNYDLRSYAGRLDPIPVSIVTVVSFLRP